MSTEEGIGRACAFLAKSETPLAESILRAVAAKNQHQEDKALGEYALAVQIKTSAEWIGWRDWGRAQAMRAEAKSLL